MQITMAVLAVCWGLSYRDDLADPRADSLVMRDRLWTLVLTFIGTPTPEESSNRLHGRDHAHRRGLMGWDDIVRRWIGDAVFGDGSADIVLLQACSASAVRTYSNLLDTAIRVGGVLLQLVGSLLISFPPSLSL